MKKIIIPFVIACITFAACQKEITDPTKPACSNGESLELVLTASQDNTSKTSLDGISVKWTDTDKVTVMYKKTGESTWSTALSGTASSEDSYATATFSVTLDSADTEKEAYAIYPANELAQDVADKAKITIASTQYPTGTNFDGNSDILISKSFIPSSSVTTQFARLGAILKISIDNDDLDEEKLLNLSVEGPNDLAGDVLVGLSDKTVKGIVNGSETVTAVYASEKQFELGAADKFVYLIVKPQTWANGSTITINGETENTTFTKAIILDKDIHLNAGHIIPLRVSIPSYTLKNKAFVIARFDDNDGTGGNDGSWSGSIASKDIKLPAGWTSTNGKGAKQCVKFGTGSEGGSLKAKGLTIPDVYNEIKLSFKAAAWDAKSENTSLSLSATHSDIKNESNETVTSVTMSKGAWTLYEYTIKNITDTVAVTFSTAAGNSRFFIDDVCLYYGPKPKKSADLSYAVSPVVKLTTDAAFTNTLSNPNSLSVNYVSSDPTVATVDSEGEVTVLKKGTTRITASSTETVECLEGEAYYELTVTTPPTLAFSWTRSSSTDTVTGGYTLSKLRAGGGGTYYQESGSVGQTTYIKVYNSSSAMFSSTPASIILTATIGAGSARALSSPVYACLVDSSGNDMVGTEIEITSNITTAAGDEYVKLFTPIETAYGVKLYHTKEDGINVRFFSFNLKYSE